ncbi:MAG TPA: PPC domain-containing DNA-binding protein [Acidobacteriaceae bacterium]|nr:PPC domain-containing DNA-binding protein [Acidobacteriaceae bacterium]
MTAVTALMLVFAGMSQAQETRRTEINPSPNPADDAKANSASVPDEYTLTGKFDRIVVVRLKYKANLLEGLKKAVADEHIQNGVILSGVGSLRGYEIHTVANRDMPSKDTFVKNPTQPADLVGMNGFVIRGRIHAHMTIATPDRVIAGHVEEGNEVFTFAIVAIGVMNGTDFNRIDDKTYR